MEQKTNEYKARSDDGQEYVIYEFVNIVNAGSLNDPTAVIKGTKRLITANGEDINFKEEGVFEIVNSGVILRKIND